MVEKQAETTLSAETQAVSVSPSATEKPTVSTSAASQNDPNCPDGSCKKAQDIEPQDNPKRKKTGGEVAFDRIVYTGIGFGVNEAGALAITVEAEHGHGWLNKYFTKAVDIVEKKIEAKDAKLGGGIAKAAEKLAEGIEKAAEKGTPRAKALNLVTTFTVLLSGTMLVWPMKLLEDSKAYWVKKANHALDKITGRHLSAEDVAARDQKSDEAIACQSKQSWPSLLTGRLIAIGATMGNSAFVTQEKGMNKARALSEEWITEGTKKANKLVGSPLSEKTIGKIDHKDSKFRKYANLAGMETICCVVSSLTLEIASKFCAGMSPQVKNPELCAKVEARDPYVLQQNEDSTDTSERSKQAEHRHDHSHAHKHSRPSSSRSSIKPSERTASSIASKDAANSFVDAAQNQKSSSFSPQLS